MKIYFVSFADKRFHKSQKRITKQAKEFGVFEDVFSLNENNLANEFRNKFAEFLYPHTFYLCAWKPEILSEIFNKINTGDLLLYADVGCHINVKGKKRFLEYCEQVKASKSGILATVLGDSMAESNWTNGDTLRYFKCESNDEIINTGQIQATTLLIQKRTSTINFLKEWLRVFSDRPDLAKRANAVLPNLTGFIEHRSDQSFFSILGKKSNIELITSYEVQGSANWDIDMIEYPIWAKRDRILDDGFWYHPTPGRALLLFKRAIVKFVSKL